jgi:hypothetical protein
MYLRKPWLPNGRERLAVGLAACGDDCIPLTAQHGGGGVDPVVVKNGQFSDGPFTDKGAALRPGRYVLEIWIFGATNDEPPDVLAIIGSRGENMLGPLVGACCFAFIGTQAELQKERDDAPERALHLGASIYYARYVEIGPPVPNSLSQSYQPQPQPLRTPNAVQDQSRSPVTTAFTECLLSQGRNGSYTSFDGGMSAIRLMGVACKAQWDAWQDECIAQGGTDGGPGGCTMQAGIMAQAALKMLGK